MKYLNKLYTFLIAAMLMVSIGCTETETQAVFDGSFVAFTVAETSILEGSSGSITLEVNMAGPLLSNDLTVEYTATAVTGSAGNFTLSDNTGTLVIPAGEVSATVDFFPVNNFDEDGDKLIEITITSVSEDLTIGLPGPDENNKTVAITISDDDCAFDLVGDYAGTYTVAEVFTSGTNAGLTLAGAFGETYAVELTADATDPSGTVGIWSNVAGNDTFFNGGTSMTFLPCTSEVSFGGAPQIAVFANLTIESSSFSDGVITLSGPLGGFGPYEIVLTRD